MSDLPTKVTGRVAEPYGPDELVIEALDEEALRKARDRNVARVRLLWSRRRLLMRAALAGLLLATAIAFLIPKRYRSTAELMPPDQASGSGAAMLAALSSQVGGGLAGMAAGAPGMENTGAVCIGVRPEGTVGGQRV